MSEGGDGPLKGGDRGFSIAFGYGGLLLGGFAWVLAWGAMHLPARGQERTYEERMTITTLDIVLMVLLPLLGFLIVGRYGRKWLP